MTQKLDYSREEAMQILNNENYSDEQKRTLYNEYMNALKKNRKDTIVNKLNEYAKDIPVITKEIYISKIKEYENDDLTKPFEIIEKELSNFENDMKLKYNEYLQSKQQEVIPEVEDIKDEETFDDTIFSEPIVDVENFEDIEDEEEVKPSLVITNEISVINEDPEEDIKPLFENANDETKDFIPDENDTTGEKGNASAIIISIIAVIIGILVMYSIIKLN